VGGWLTVKVTATVAGDPVAPDEPMVTAAMYEPGARAAVLAATWIVAALVPLVGVTDSQLPPEAVETLAVQASTLPVGPVLEIASD
jgi:hypothetical protein